MSFISMFFKFFAPVTSTYMKMNCTEQTKLKQYMYIDPRYYHEQKKVPF